MKKMVKRMCYVRRFIIHVLRIGEETLMLRRANNKFPENVSTYWWLAYIISRSKVSILMSFVPLGTIVYPL